MHRFAQLLFAAATLLALALAVQQHATLPEKVATHFGANGQANGWMSRDTHSAFQIGTTVFLAAVFAGLALFMPRLPDRHINLPHRDYWPG